jgi:hypothetical protein
MKNTSLWIWVLWSCLGMAGTAAEPNTLTPAERAEGWRLLFNGKNLEGWRSVRRATPPTTGWVVTNGWLVKVAGQRGGDLISTQRFENFELSWEWRIPARANNGVKYMFTEERGVGHEYQMIDDATIKNPKQQTASFYDVLPPRPHAPMKLAPEINHSRVVVRGNHVEHWLNGEKVLEYECGSPELLAAVAKSKFREVPDFGKKIAGHLLLTDHNDEAAFRNVKVRELPAP